MRLASGADSYGTRDKGHRGAGIKDRPVFFFFLKRDWWLMTVSPLFLSLFIPIVSLSFFIPYPLSLSFYLSLCPHLTLHPSLWPPLWFYLSRLSLVPLGSGLLMDWSTAGVWSKVPLCGCWRERPATYAPAARLPRVLVRESMWHSTRSTAYQDTSPSG